MPMVNQLRSKFKVHFPVGGQLCTTCRNIEERKLSVDHVDDAGHQEEADDSFQSAPSVSDLNSSIKDIAPTISPFKYQLRSPVEDVALSTQRYLKRKVDSCVQAVTDYLCESIAPGQGQEIKKRLIESTQEDKQLSSLKEAYQAAPTNLAKAAIISLAPLSKQQVKDKFGCSKYLVEKARQLKAENSLWEKSKDSEPSYRIRRDMNKVEHFLDFLFRNRYFEDSYFATSSLKLQHGTMFEIPQVALTTIQSSVITIYENHCNSVNYQPLSTSCLRNIMKSCKSVQRKALHGVDNYTADGLEAFDTLSKVLEKTGGSKAEIDQIKKSLKAAVTYLKGDFKVHIKEESTCPTHCRKFALSNWETRSEFFREQCKHHHNEVCQDCENIFSCLSTIKEMIDNATLSSEIKDELAYDFSIAYTYILEWINHILRGTHTQSTKEKILV